MSFGKFLAILVLSVIGVLLVVKIVGAVLGWALGTILNIAIPVALVVGIVFVVFRLTEKKVLGDTKRDVLP